MWGNGEMDELSNLLNKNRFSYDVNNMPSSSWREGRDDMDSGRDEAEEKVKQFDLLLQRIEDERHKIKLSGAETSTMQQQQRLGTIATPRRSGQRNPPPVYSSSYDFASRARELRMSLDGATGRLGTPIRAASASPSHFDTQPIPARPPPLPKMKPPSMSPAPPASPAQVEGFCNSLQSAHDTITALEDDVRALTRTLEEKEGCILHLEHKTKSLKQSLTRHKAQEGKDNSNLKNNNEEMEKLRSECDEYKKQSWAAEKLAAERQKEANETNGAKLKLETTLKEKDAMIGSLRNEIQRLNEELADGSFVRSQALKAEEAAKKVKVDLEKLKEDHMQATELIVELEIRSKKKEDAHELELLEKDKEIATLRSNAMGSDSIRDASERLRGKISDLESQLNDSKEQNELLQSRLDDADRAAIKKEKEQSWSQSREKELKKQLEKERAELERQRLRIEQCNDAGASDQESVAALERAIEELEKAHDESNAKIARLQKENQSLTAKASLQRACESNILKSRIDELEGSKSDLDDQLQKKDDLIRQMTDRTRDLEDESKKMTELAHDLERKSNRILKLEKRLAQKQEEIYRLEQELSGKQEIGESAADTLIEVTALFEQNERELEKLRAEKSTMQMEIDEFQRKLESKGSMLDSKISNDQVVNKFQKEAKRAWRRVGELETHLKSLQDELACAERSGPVDNQKIRELQTELASVRERLAERDGQLRDSRNGIAEAQKMIFRLMNTIQDLRKKAKERESNN